MNDMIGRKLGRYTIVRLLGSGGMGSVYYAEHDRLKRPAAIKVIDPKLLTNPQIVERFHNEAQLAALLKHEHLIGVYDHDQDPVTGAFYMALEYLPGQTLSDFLNEHPGPADPKVILRIVAHVASALKVVHARGAVHRDIKPDNIFLTERNGEKLFAVVLDFGVAHVSAEVAKAPLTVQGGLIGTIVYASPEQIRGQRVSSATDVYALGVVAYVALTNAFPYQAPQETIADYINLTPFTLGERQEKGAIDPMHRYVAGMTGRLSAAIMHALELKPSDRPSLDEFIRELYEAIDGGMQVARDAAREFVRDDAPTPAPGTLIASASKADSQYELLGRIGRGGMAEVHLARRVGEGGFAKRVAIKRVLPGFSDDPTFLKLFTAEAEFASRLDHVNIVQVFDFSRDAEGRLFLVMEYVPFDLAKLLASGPLAPSLIIYIVSEMCAALSYAHSLPDPTDPTERRRGIVHRDISPANTLLSYEGIVKVSDFGIALAMTTSGVAKGGTALGNAKYMSPEQVLAKPLDGRSDLYSVGVLLHEMLTHRALFDGTAAEAIVQKFHRPIPEPHAVYSRVPPDLEAIAIRCLAQDPAERFQSADELRAALLRCEDAPRDGRAELANVLAERFPASEARKRTTGVDHSTPRALIAQQMPVATPLGAMPSTLSSTASQSVPRPPAKSRAPAFVAIGAAIVAIGASVVFIAMKRLPTHARRAQDASVVAASPTILDAPRAVVTLDAGVSAPIDAGIVASIPADAPRMVDAAPLVTASAHVTRPSNATTSPTEHEPAIPAGFGELKIYAHPYAYFTINGGEKQQTPLHDRHFPSGRYVVRYWDDDGHKPETAVITVLPGKTTTIDKTWGPAASK